MSFRTLDMKEKGKCDPYFTDIISFKKSPKLLYKYFINIGLYFKFEMYIYNYRDFK